MRAEEADEQHESCDKVGWSGIVLGMLDVLLFLEGFDELAAMLVHVKQEEGRRSVYKYLAGWSRYYNR